MRLPVNDTELILQTLETAAENLRNGTAELHVPQERLLRQCIPGHLFHPYHELFIQISGSNQFTFPESQLIMDPGDIMLLPADLSHQEIGHVCDAPFLHLVVMFVAKGLTIHLGSGNPGEPPVPSVVLDYEHLRYPALRQITTDCVDCLGANTKTPPELKNGLALVLFGYLIDQLRNSSPIKQADLHPKVREIKRLVDIGLPSPHLSVKQLARIISCNPDYLSDLFHKETGEPLSACITRKRMEKARDYLMTTTMTISEVAWACGYNDLSYFSYKFRKAHGCSPGAYRRQNERPVASLEN